ncbi:MAG: LacI family DNA-binding transcriptional regulator [Armatimonadetes bacterium]|nr:LacI family DNA-binding transcriptional regulator [Armatimonadota bacterium]
MAVTLKTVAERAGVTPTVVSRVLHNKALSIRVSEATAERVRQAAKDLNYRVNAAARGLRERQTMSIGILHGVGFGRPRFDYGSRYFAQLMDGIVEGAFNHGYSVTLCPKLLGDDPTDALADGRFDGLVWYSTSPSEENHQLLEKTSLPLVLIHSTGEDFGGRFPTVICDNYQGIGLALDHLQSLGHRRIGFAIVSEDSFGEGKIRHDAFVAQMLSRDLPVSERDIVDVNWDGAGFGRYLDDGIRHTAFLAVSDGAAGRMIETAQSRGLNIPHDLSIVGFDSTAYCNEFRPSITSVAQPLFKIGETAIDLLVKTIQQETVPDKHLVIPCGFDLRESTTSPP